MSDLRASLANAFGPESVAVNAPLAPLTTFGIGGAAAYLVSLKSTADLPRALEIARQAGTSITLLGGGSNVLVADAGIRGLVIRMHGGQVRQVAADRIRTDAGVTINGLVRWTITHGLAGLEAWAGTPGTVGGAIFGNAHFRGRNISDLVAQVAVSSRDGGVEQVPHARMEFAYDFSRLHRTGEVVLAADFIVMPGEPESLRATARESLAYRKRTQPLAQPSAGCIFQNPDSARDQVPAGIPLSAGALIDRAGLKGAREGRARVSPLHANFIVNEGNATAADVRRLIDRCTREVRRQFDVQLREEIMCLGFDGGHLERGDGGN